MTGARRPAVLRVGFALRPFFRKRRSPLMRREQETPGMESKVKRGAARVFAEISQLPSFKEIVKMRR